MRTIQITNTKPRTSFNQLLGWLWRVLLTLIALALLGVTYQIVATVRDARAFPPPGQLIDVGGFKLHIHCIGTGNPTIVTENGLGGSSPDWSLIQPAISQNTRICSYDRAGTGWSDAAFTPRTSEQIAQELHTLLIHAGETGPYLLVGHSVGGMHAQVYANRYPTEVAGLVLVDPTPAQAIVRFSPEQQQQILPNLGQFQLLEVMQFFGLLRLLPLFEDEVLTALPEKLQAQMRAHHLQSGSMTALAAESAGIATSIQQTVVATPMPSNRPLLILWHGIPSEPVELEPQARAAMEALVQASNNGRFVVAEKSGHLITLEQPARVIDAVNQVIVAVRTGKALR